jgi:uncharacterized protein YndB with AHSA1/START domain
MGSTQGSTRRRPARITRKDSILVPEGPEKVFSAVADLHSYRDWWPRSIRFHVEDSGPVRVGTRMRISNRGWVRWVAEVAAIEANSRIAFHYGQGAWEGTAEWTLKSESGGVRVSYSVDIVPVPFWIRMLGKFVDLGAMHSRQMQGVLDNLKAHVQQATDLRS